MPSRLVGKEEAEELPATVRTKRNPARQLKTAGSARKGKATEKEILAKVSKTWKLVWKTGKHGKFG